MNYPLKDAIVHYIQTENAENLVRVLRALINHYPKETLDSLMNILGTHDTARILTVLGGIYCQNKEEMSLKSAYMTPENKKNAIKKLKMAAVLQYTLPGVPCIYYGDENGEEGHIDPFCRRCYAWDNQNADLIAFYAKLGEIRKEYCDVFKDGYFELVYASGGLIFYKRKGLNSEIYIYANNSSKSELFEINEKLTDCLNDNIYENKMIIKPYSYGILKK